MPKSSLPRESFLNALAAELEERRCSLFDTMADRVLMRMWIDGYKVKRCKSVKDEKRAK